MAKLNFVDGGAKTPFVKIPIGNLGGSKVLLYNGIRSSILKVKLIFMSIEKSIIYAFGSNLLSIL